MKNVIARLTAIVAFMLVAAPLAHAEDAATTVKPAPIIIKMDPCGGC